MIRQKFTDIKKNINNNINFIKFISLLILIAYLIVIFFYDVKLYHNVLAFIRIIIIFIFTMFSLNIYENTGNIRIAFLGISLGIVGIYDLLSMAFISGIVIQGIYSQDISVKLWIIARLIEAISFFIGSINISKKLNLKGIFAIYISIFLLSIYTILYANMVPDLWIDDIGHTNILIAIKRIIFSLNILTICYHIFKTRIIGMKANKLFIFIILFTLISDIKLEGNIYERKLLNFVVISSKLLSYYLIFKFIRKEVLKSDYDRSISNLNKKDILEYALKSSLEGIIIIGNNKEVLYFNDSFNYILGCPKNIKNMSYNEMIDRLIKNIKNPETLKRQVLKSIETGEDHVGNIYFKNGEVYKGRSFEFIVESELLGRIISIVNTTESYKLKELEVELEHKEDAITNLKELDSLKTEFIGNITHDFRTPITIIMSTIELWDLRQEQYGKAIDLAFTKESYKTIKLNCLRLLKLTNNLIDITKISRDYMKLTFKNHNVVFLVEEITMSVLNYSEKEGVNLIFDTNIEEKIMACHSDSIERIILNLLSNAIKFTPRGGLIEINLNDKDDFVFISIKDSGIGIPKEMHKNIFEPFKQVDSSAKREKEGSGIGLSLVRYLVEEHGGKIYINDELITGTEFIIQLPVNLTHDNIIEEYIVDERRLSIELSDI